MHPDDLKTLWLCREFGRNFIFHSDVEDHKRHFRHSKMIMCDLPAGRETPAMFTRGRMSLDFRLNGRMSRGVQCADREVQEPCHLRQGAAAQRKRALNCSDARIVACDYKQALRKAREGDFVFIDPPFHTLSATAHFVDSTRSGFGERDQIELAQAFCELDRKG